MQDLSFFGHGREMTRRPDEIGSSDLHCTVPGWAPQDLPVLLAQRLVLSNPAFSLNSPFGRYPDNNLDTSVCGQLLARILQTEITLEFMCHWVLCRRPPPHSIALQVRTRLCPLQYWVLFLGLRKNLESAGSTFHLTNNPEIRKGDRFQVQSLVRP